MGVNNHQNYHRPFYSLPSREGSMKKISESLDYFKKKIKKKAKVKKEGIDVWKCDSIQPLLHLSR